MSKLKWVLPLLLISAIAVAALTVNNGMPAVVNRVSYLPVIHTALINVAPDGGSTDLVENQTFSISGTQISTSTIGASFRGWDNFTEPSAPIQGRAWEFMVNGNIGSAGSGDPWAIETNSVFTIQNGIGGTSTIVDVYGNVGPLVHNVDNNRLLLTQYMSSTPLDGVIDYLMVDSFGYIELSDFIYSYSTNGTAGGGNEFDLVVSDGVDSAIAVLPCDNAAGTTAPQVGAWTGTTTFNNFATLTVSYANTGDCAVVPVIRSIYIHHVFTTAPL